MLLEERDSEATLGSRRRACQVFRKCLLSERGHAWAQVARRTRGLTSRNATRIKLAPLGSNLHGFQLPRKCSSRNSVTEAGKPASRFDSFVSPGRVRYSWLKKCRFRRNACPFWGRQGEKWGKFEEFETGTGSTSNPHGDRRKRGILDPFLHRLLRGLRLEHLATRKEGKTSWGSEGFMRVTRMKISRFPASCCLLFSSSRAGCLGSIESAEILGLIDARSSLDIDNSVGGTRKDLLKRDIARGVCGWDRGDVHRE